jgi:hypothetical protein
VTNLSNRIIERTKPAANDKYIADGAGLFLRVMPNGTKSFCFSPHPRCQASALVPCPRSPYSRSLAEARDRAIEARRLVVMGKDSLDTASETGGEGHIAGHRRGAGQGGERKAHFAGHQSLHRPRREGEGELAALPIWLRRTLFASREGCGVESVPASLHQSRIACRVPCRDDSDLGLRTPSR